MLKILALDPATKCGWATQYASGTWDLSVRRDESSGMRLIRLKAKLDRIMFSGIKIEHPELVPRLIVFEAARHAAPKMANALSVQSELQGVIKLFCEENGIQFRGYSPSEIKKHATGKGNANKAAMLAAARAKWPDKTIADDNEADALWLLDLALSEYTVATLDD